MERRKSASSTRRWRICLSAWTFTATEEGAESASGVGTTRRGSTAKAALPGSSGRLRCTTRDSYAALHLRVNATHLVFLVFTCFHLTRCELMTTSPASRACATRAALSARLACRIQVRQLPVRTKTWIAKFKISPSLSSFRQFLNFSSSLNLFISYKRGIISALRARFAYGSSQQISTRVPLFFN